MGRVINPETSGKERKRLVKATVLAIRALMKQQDVTNETRDLAAFIALAIDAIWKTVDLSVAPWEKRGYWVKADKFRMEWEWTRTLGGEMRKALFAEDWSTVAQLAVRIGKKLDNVQVSDRHRMGKPWVGSWARIKNNDLK